jgi:hypothetical protein
MRVRASGAIAIVVGVCAVIGGAQANDDASNPNKYPNWRGQWYRTLGVQWDASKPPGRGQQAPLTPEYQARYEASLAEQRLGGQDYKPQVKCMPAGMPQMMIAYEPVEIIVTPQAIYMWMVYMHEFRRIYTDGRDFPAKIAPSFGGYSIGKWLDTKGNGKYDTLEVETRNFKGPRIFEPTGIPMHDDDQTVIKERIALDPADPNLINDEITTIDNALTRPWTVTRQFKRIANPAWAEYFCHEHNTIVILQKETYFIREDGYLMPSRKDQPPPDLRKFTPTGN